MAKGSSDDIFKLALVGVLGYVGYSSALTGQLGTIPFQMAKAIQLMIHAKTGDPGTGTDTPTTPGEPCTVPAFSAGNYVENLNGIFNCVRNYAVVYSSPNQSYAEQYYNWSYCPLTHPKPPGA